MLGKFLLGSAVLGSLLLVPVVSFGADEGSVNINAEDDITILSEETEEALDELVNKYNFSYEIDESQINSTENDFETINFESVEELESLILATQKSDSEQVLDNDYPEDELGLLNNERTHRVSWWSMMDILDDPNGWYTTRREIQFTGNTSSSGVLSNITITDSSVRGISAIQWTMDGSQPVTYNSGNTEANLEVYGTYHVVGTINALPLNANWYGEFGRTVDALNLDGISVDDPLDPPF